MAWIAGLWEGLEQAGYPDMPLTGLAIADYLPLLDEYALRVQRDKVKALVDSMADDLEAAESDVGGTPAAHAPPEAVCAHCRPRREVPDWAPARFVSQATAAPASSRLLRMFPDIAAYLIIPEFRERVHDVVRQSIAEHSPCVLVAHSLGALAAIKAVAAGRSGVRALVTVGSPAALPALRGPMEISLRAAYPEISGLPWLNVVNPYDGVTGGFLAVPPHFPATVRNLVVANRGEPHNVGRYLAHPPVGAFIASAAQHRGPQPAPAVRAASTAPPQAGEHSNSGPSSADGAAPTQPDQLS